MDLSSEVQVWPENFKAVQIFDAMATQWRPGFKTFFGLDYQVLPWMFRLYQVSAEEEQEVLYCVRVMENEALILMREG
jgi:hypothetical protein